MSKSKNENPLTNARQSKEMVIQKEIQYKVILDNIPDVAWLKDIESRFIAVNEPYAKACGIPSENLIGKTDLDIWPYELAQKYRNDDKNVIQLGERSIFVEQFVDVKGNRGWIETIKTPIYDENKEVFCTTGIARNVTAREKMKIELQKAKEAAEIANHAKSKFIANMSHEIRTPLNGIVGMLDLIEMLGLSEEQNKYAIMAKTCSENLLSLIDDILDFSKIEAGKLVLEKSEFDFKELLEKIIEIHTLSANKKGLNFLYRPCKDLPVRVLGDENKVKQIINNIVGNAIKFTEHGWIHVCIEKCENKNGFVEMNFSVKDSGIGIPNDKLNLLFLSFSQVDSTITKKYGGTGLGLTISKQLIEMMGGRIWVESEAGIGTTFNFTLEFETKDVNSGNHEPVIIDNCKEKVLNILLVEDDKVNQAVVATYLGVRGHKIDIANNGEEGIILFSKKSYDIILMDIQMPKMNGIDATKEIRKREEKTNSHVPIIALTAYAIKGDRERFLSVGMDEYITKPFQKKDLFDAIKRLTQITNT